jgi:hypothetical protein
VKGIPWEEFEQELTEMRKSVILDRPHPRGRATSGVRPAPRSQG